MNRKFLEELKIGDQSLTKEQIDSIMAENGKDVEATKAKTDKTQEIENLKTELKTTKETLDQANVQIKNFEGMDVAAKDKAIKEWETKYSDLEANAKTEREANENTLKQQAYEFKLSEATGQLKFPNELTKKAFMNELKTKNLPLEGEKILGFEDYIKEIGEQNPGMFVTDAAPVEETTLPTLVASTGGQVKQESGSKFGFNFNTVRPLPKE